MKMVQTKEQSYLLLLMNRKDLSAHNSYKVNINRLYPLHFSSIHKFLGAYYFSISLSWSPNPPFYLTIHSYLKRIIFTL